MCVQGGMPRCYGPAMRLCEHIPRNDSVDLLRVPIKTADIQCMCQSVQVRETLEIANGVKNGLYA